MSFLNNLNIGKKLALIIIIAFVALISVAALGFYETKIANRSINEMYAENFVPNDLIAENLGNVYASNGRVLELMLTTDAQRNQVLNKSIADYGEQINKNFAALEKVPMGSNGKALFEKVKTSRQNYLAVRSDVVKLATQNKNAEAYALYVSQVIPAAGAYVKDFQELSTHYSKRAEKLSEATAAAEQQAVLVMTIVSMAAMLLLLLSGWAIARAITKPLQFMVEICRELAQGNFAEAERKVRRKDEIGQLADALTDMRTNVRKTLKQVNESAEQVAASSEELTASAEQSAQAVTQVATAITDVADGATRQLTAATETSAVVEQMSAGIQQIAANTNQVATNSAQAADKAREGDVSVNKAVDQMVSIEQTVNSSAKVVAKLGERSKEIGQIVNTISGIAGQTNLLALNAAIEAARAGEQGRGFAVVAEEVRKLAEQSEGAAKQIASLISEIQGDTDKAVVAMDEGTREVKVGSEVVTAAGQAFKEITALILQVSDQVREISAAVQQMASGTQQIVHSVKEIDSLSKSAASETQTVSAATEEQSASMEEIASSSQELAKLAQDLQAAVNKFRL